MDKNLLNLNSVGLFHASPEHLPHPVKIPAKIALVELLSGGRLFFEVGGELQTFRKGAMFWHIGGDYTIYKTPPDDPYSCYTFRFEVNEDIRNHNRVSIWNSPDAAMQFSEEVLKAFHEGTINREFLKEYVETVLTWNEINGTKNLTARYPHALLNAINYIDNNFMSGISAEDVAEKSGISQPYLFTLFRKYLQTSPHKYILQQRTTKAKMLLAGDMFTIKEISAECGFDSLEVFYRHFNQNTNITPAEYRKLYARKEY